MNILIARPQPEAAALAARLNAQGHDCFVWPALQFSAARDLAPQQAFITQSTPEDIVIVTSQQVLRYANDKLLSTLKQRCCFAIGQSSAQALQAMGASQVVYPNKPGSEGLLALPALQQHTGRTVWLLRAQAGRELLIKTLRQQGKTVHPVCCYQRDFNTADQEALISYLQQPVDIVIATSVSVLQSLKQATARQAGALWPAVAVTVIGETMLHYANKLGCLPIVLPQVDNDYLAQWVEQYHHEHKQ